MWHFGLALYGKVHKTSTGRYICTKFVHICWVPVAPDQSYIVLRAKGSEFQGVKIPLDRFSIVIAYLRGVALGSFVFVPITLFAIAGEGSAQQLLPPWMWKWLPLPGAWLLVCLFGACWSYLDPRITKANQAREAWMDEQVNRSLDAVRSPAVPQLSSRPLKPL